MNAAPTYSETERNARLEELIQKPSHYDLVVVGGGITGAGILREAAACGLEVLMVEQQDFAWGTSSRSSKMVHGGLRYLGKGQFSLANDSVKERQNLMQQLPGLVDLLPFAMSHYKGKFPGPWVFDKLLAIYDFMAGKRYRRHVHSGITDYWLPGVKSEQLTGTTFFADAVTDDSALVIRVINEARRYGATALNYVKAVSFGKGAQNRHVLRLLDQASDREFEITADVVINATGAWTDALRACLGKGKRIRPLRGSHIVVPFWRLPVAFSLTFFHPEDKRPVFVFPWEGQTVVGTTDLDHHGDLSHEASMTEEELDYLLDAANSQFSNAVIEKSDVVSSWSGVRPVVVDEGMAENPDAAPSDEKREHEIWDDNGLISIAGGKLTTFRLLALETLEKAAHYLDGKLSSQDLKHARGFPDLEVTYSENAQNGSRSKGEDHPQGRGSVCQKLSAQQIKRLQARYGTALPALLENARTDDLDRISVTESLWIELRWMCQLGSVIHLDDLLLRRTRIGLLLRDGARALLPQIQSYLTDILPWSAQRWEEEICRYEAIIKGHYSLPQNNKSEGRVDA